MQLDDDFQSGEGQSLSVFLYIYGPTDVKTNSKLSLVMRSLYLKSSFWYPFVHHILLGFRIHSLIRPLNTVVINPAVQTKLVTHSHPSIPSCSFFLDIHLSIFSATFFTIPYYISYEVIHVCNFV